ncbi:hypothetical protein EJ08DRAFT_274435 [Tothia fuscella]|uniref:Uncharacterized protein n=1 Tax=Tothia fuscella TaxID=1048955 RepID=A0A9P4NQB6_9PEZI|nr:hypothetical protein EJ08DRAFT_274435 [Tothia fuscella]
MVKVYSIQSRMEPPVEPTKIDEREELQRTAEESNHGQYHGAEPASNSSSRSGDGSDNDDDPEEDDAAPPQHPIPSMQGPFEESIADASMPEIIRPLEKEGKDGAKARRQILLDTNQPNDTYNARWKAAIDSCTYHPLSKVVAQIAFGVHLLHQELAKSDEEVVRILQRHVDEVDGFLQRTEEDLDFALADVRERINYLKLPLEHGNIFDIMLEDRQFRTSILEGNDRIERVVNRTAHLMNDLHVDVAKTLEATIQMGRYLTGLKSWPEGDSGSIEIYRTMQLNADGWEECLAGLQLKANGLGVALVQLGSILNEMAKRAGAASRRNLEPTRPTTAESHYSSRMMSPPPLSKYSRKAMKALPEDPDAYKPAQSRKEQEFEQRYENPRPQPPTPTMTSPAMESHKSPRRQGSRQLQSNTRSGSSASQRLQTDRYMPEKSPRRTASSYRHSAEASSSRPTTSRPTTSRSKSNTQWHPKNPRPRSSRPRSDRPKPEEAKSAKTKPKKIKPDKIKPEKSKKEKKKKSKTNSDPLTITPHKRSKTNESVFRTSFLRNALSSDPHENPPPMPDMDISQLDPPQSRLQRARSKLARTKKTQPNPEQKIQEKGERALSPFGPDSAYSSGCNASHPPDPIRPMTSPSITAPRKPASFTLFPSTPSMLSLVSPPMIHSNKGSEWSLPTALPPMPKQNMQSPLQRRVSMHGGGVSGENGRLGLKKRSSLIALKNFFRREKGGSRLRAMSQVYELPG